MCLLKLVTASNSWYRRSHNFYEVPTEITYTAIKPAIGSLHYVKSFHSQRGLSSEGHRLWKLDARNIARLTTVTSFWRRGWRKKNADPVAGRGEVDDGYIDYHVYGNYSKFVSPSNLFVFPISVPPKNKKVLWGFFSPPRGFFYFLIIPMLKEYVMFIYFNILKSIFTGHKIILIKTNKQKTTKTRTERQQQETTCVDFII